MSFVDFINRKMGFDSDSDISVVDEKLVLAYQDALTYMPQSQVLFLDKRSRLLSDVEISAELRPELCRYQMHGMLVKRSFCSLSEVIDIEDGEELMPNDFVFQEMLLRNKSGFIVRSFAIWEAFKDSKLYDSGTATFYSNEANRQGMFGMASILTPKIFCF